MGSHLLSLRESGSVFDDFSSLLGLDLRGTD